VNRGSSHSSFAEEVAHEFRVALRATKAQDSQTRPLGELVEYVLRPLRCGDGRGERSFVEPSAAPRDVRIIDFVRNAEVMKWTQELAAYALGEIAAIHEVFLTERE
jgi:hypothetical protein